MEKDKIYITGPSGAGKSTLAKALGEKLNLPVYSMDDSRTWYKWFNKNKNKAPNETQASYEEVSKNLINEYTAKSGPAIIEGQQLLVGSSLPANTKTFIVLDPGKIRTIAQRVKRQLKHELPLEEKIQKAQALYEANEPRLEAFRQLKDSRITFINKTAEFAPGIPDKNVIGILPNVSSPDEWEYVLQEHNADRANLHYDFRIGPAGGPGFSWVLKHGLPENGAKTLAIQQPIHELSYFDFQGEIKSGYGKGTVRTAARGKVQIVKSDGDKITFLIPDGSLFKKYSLIKTNEKDWLMLNHTFSKATGSLLAGVSPLKYKDASKNYIPKPGDISTPKIDGASSITILQNGKVPLVFGKRISKKTGLPIEYTPKIYDIYNKKSPSSLGTTILRTEVFGINSQNKEIPNRTLAGLLNSNLIKSKEDQKKLNTPLRLAAFDIIKFKGRDVSKLPFSEKLKLISEVNKEYPYIEDPINLGKKILFPEGKVVWRGTEPIKIKNKPDWDVFVKNVFPADTKKSPRAGGITYSLTPGGPEVGRVGTGWRESELKDMLANKENYIGRVAKVFAQEQHPGGALRSPSFANWHLDK